MVVTDPMSWAAKPAGETHMGVLQGLPAHSWVGAVGGASSRWVSLAMHSSHAPARQVASLSATAASERSAAESAAAKRSRMAKDRTRMEDLIASLNSTRDMVSPTRTKRLPRCQFGTVVIATDCAELARPT